MRKLFLALILMGGVMAASVGSAAALTVPASSQGQAHAPVSGTVECSLAAGDVDTVVLSGTAGQATISVDQTCSENAAVP